MAVEITEEFVWQSIPPRARDSHKGTFGSVLAVAGSAFYRGAALLAAEGALRTGAGIVTLASVEPVVSAAVTRLPECCLCPCKEGEQGGIAPENVPLLRRQKATVLLMTFSPWMEAHLVCSSSTPLRRLISTSCSPMSFLSSPNCTSC